MPNIVYRDKTPHPRIALAKFVTWKWGLSCTALPNGEDRIKVKRSLGKGLGA